MAGGTPELLARRQARMQREVGGAAGRNPLSRIAQPASALNRQRSLFSSNQSKGAADKFAVNPLVRCSQQQQQQQAGQQQDDHQHEPQHNQTQHSQVGSNLLCHAVPLLCAQEILCSDQCIRLEGHH